MSEAAVITGAAGAVGSITWAYYTAATIHRFAIVGHGKGETRTWTLRAELLHTDPYKLAQRPLELVIPTAAGSWTWPIVTLTRDGDHLTATLGPAEAR